MKKAIFTIATVLLCTVVYSQSVMKYRAYQRTIYNPDGSKEISTVNAMIVIDTKESKVSVYGGDKTMNVDIIQYLDAKEEGVTGFFSGVDDMNNKVKVSLKLLDYPEAFIVFDYASIKGGGIAYLLKSTQ